MDQHKQSSHKLRQRKFRQNKILKDPDFRKKECERIKKIQKQKKEKMTPIQVEELRIQKRNQKRLERAKKRLQNLASATIRSNEAKATSPGFRTTSHLQPYKSGQTYTKAVLKCLQSLPSCPLKQKLVVEGVCKRVGVKLAEGMKSRSCDRKKVKAEKPVITELDNAIQVAEMCEVSIQF